MHDHVVVAASGRDHREAHLVRVHDDLDDFSGEGDSDDLADLRPSLIKALLESGLSSKDMQPPAGKKGKKGKKAESEDPAPAAEEQAGEPDRPARPGGVLAEPRAGR